MTTPGGDRSLGGGSTAGKDTSVVTSPPGTTNPQPIVSPFTLLGSVVGHQTGTDTTQVVPVGGAGVTLVKIAEVNGDTLNPSVTVTTAVTAADGSFRLENLPAAYYRVDVRAPAGTPFGDGAGATGPARSAEVTMQIALPRR